MDRLAGPDQYMTMLGCIQGKTDLQTAFQTCVAGHTQADWLWKCAHNKHGRYLHFLAGEETEKLGTDFNFVPWVVLDGQRVNDAFYALSVS
uniref:Uncharacterized protein n=1 Tax=Ditylenchus dipsaci TaxID=166011 RepID=A0A915DEZ2_9BILA